MENLEGMKIAILVDDGFEQVELVEPRAALDKAGAETFIVSPKDKRVRGWNFTDWGELFPVDVPLDQAEPDMFDALHLPGGVMNPDTLRMQPEAVAFREGVLHRQARGGDLPRPVDHHRDRRSTGAADRPRGHRSGPTCETPARSGWTRRPWSTATS